MNEEDLMPEEPEVPAIERNVHWVILDGSGQLLRWGDCPREDMPDGATEVAGPPEIPPFESALARAIKASTS